MLAINGSRAFERAQQIPSHFTFSLSCRVNVRVRVHCRVTVSAKTADDGLLQGPERDEKKSCMEYAVEWGEVKCGHL